MSQETFHQINDLLTKIGCTSDNYRVEPHYESFLDSMIAQATDSTQLSQPDLSLNMEICDIINKKKLTSYIDLTSSARDGAFSIVKHVNRGNVTTAYLALSVLHLKPKSLIF